MPKIIIHGNDARAALARGVQKLAATIESTLGPMGMNAMIDRPIGTPLISRDGVSIASEVELFDRFENMGAQVVREVSMQTNEVAGDGTGDMTSRGCSIWEPVAPCELPRSDEWRGSDMSFLKNMAGGRGYWSNRHPTAAA